MRDFETSLKQGKILGKYETCDVIVIMESPTKNSPVFGAEQQIRAAAISHGWGSEEHLRQIRIMLKIAQNVGENKAAGKYIARILKQQRIPMVEVPPSVRNRADDIKPGSTERVDVRFLSMPTKTNKEQFRILTGYTKQSSEHARDAATLIYGRTAAWAQTTYEINQLIND